MRANGPMMPLHDTAADPQAHAASLLALGGEEGLKKMSARIRQDSHACIQQRNQHARALAVVLALMPHVDAELASTGHGINRIDDQVGEHLT